MASSLFRQEAIEAGRHKLTGTVIAAVPPSSRLYTGLLLAAVLALVVFMSVGSFANKAQVRGTVTYSVSAASVVAPRAGKIIELHVREGERVAKGAPVATLQIAQGRDAGGEGIASQLAEIDAQLRELERQKGLSDTLGQTEIGSLRTQRAGLTQSLASLERQKGLIGSQIRLLEDKYQRAARLAKKGASTKQEVEDLQADVLGRKIDLEAINERIIAQRETLRTVEAQIASRAIGADQSGSESPSASPRWPRNARGCCARTNCNWSLQWPAWSAICPRAPVSMCAMPTFWRPSSPSNPSLRSNCSHPPARSASSRRGRMCG